MDEFDIKVLEANGYSYNYGGIVDKDSNYHSVIELNGKTYTSESNLELWKRGQELDEKDGNESDAILDNMILYNNDKKVEISSVNKKEIVKTTNTLTVNDGVKSSFKAEYKYPVVLGVSIIIYLIIKRLIK